jgi:DNA-binding LacI/PurR family transcriptional regulator
MQDLDQFGRPVVWICLGEVLPKRWLRTQRNLVAATVTEGPSPIHDSAAELAARTLLDLGHRRIALIRPKGHTPDWVARRWKLFGKAVGEEAEMRDVGPATFPDDHYGERLYSHLGTHGIPMVRRLIALRDHVQAGTPLESRLTTTERGLIADAAWLAPLLREFRPTALVVANDVLARPVYFWLRAMQIDTPGQVSLLSFDNSALLRPLPISSVDFGMGDVAYRAFHHIAGDLPVRLDRPGALYAVPRINHHGTLGSVGRPVDPAALEGELS